MKRIYNAQHSYRYDGMTAWRREFGDAMELTIHGIELEDFSRTHTIFKIQKVSR